jgi:hypothetical protein
MSSNIEDCEVIDKNDKGNKTELDTDLYYHYVVLAKKLFPDTDLHLIEYSIACHLIYDIRGEKRPDENTPEFIRANERINQLILDTRKLTKEMDVKDEPKDTEVEKEGIEEQQSEE